MRKLKKILPFLILGAVVLVGFFGYKSFSGKKGIEVSLPETSGTTEEEFSGSLKAVMALGAPMKCTWKKDDNYFGSSWVKGKSSYGEVSTEGRIAKVIYKDDCIWSWEEGNPQGMKMCFDPEEMEEMLEGAETETETEAQAQGMPSDIDYQCRPDVFTDAKFNPPAGVNFMTLEEMMGQ